MTKPSLIETKPLPASPWLIFHVHGGGFIAQTSKTHCGYLFPLAIETNVPVVCVNYALAPQMQYPTQIHQVTCSAARLFLRSFALLKSRQIFSQVLSAYFWARKNCATLGWTCEKVCAMGDSAGRIVA
jgi:hormone-sensitive lipase